jgi:hypothetical protein
LKKERKGKCNSFIKYVNHPCRTRNHCFLLIFFSNFRKDKSIVPTRVCVDIKSKPSIDLHLVIDESMLVSTILEVFANSYVPDSEGFLYPIKASLPVNVKLPKPTNADPRDNTIDGDLEYKEWVAKYEALLANSLSGKPSSTSSATASSVSALTGVAGLGAAKTQSEETSALVQYLIQQREARKASNKNKSKQQQQEQKKGGKGGQKGGASKSGQSSSGSAPAQASGQGDKAKTKKANTPIIIELPGPSRPAPWAAASSAAGASSPGGASVGSSAATAAPAPAASQETKKIITSTNVTASGKPVIIVTKSAAGR